MPSPCSSFKSLSLTFALPHSLFPNLFSLPFFPSPFSLSKSLLSYFPFHIPSFTIFSLHLWHLHHNLDTNPLLLPHIVVCPIYFNPPPHTHTHTHTDFTPFASSLHSLCVHNKLQPAVRTLRVIVLYVAIMTFVSYMYLFLIMM